MRATGLAALGQNSMLHDTVLSKNRELFSNLSHHSLVMSSKDPSIATFGARARAIVTISLNYFQDNLVVKSIMIKEIDSREDI